MTSNASEKREMGRVTTEIRVESLKDLFAVEQGQLSDDQVRRVTIPDALVDTGATFFSLPSRIIKELGLSKAFTKRVLTSRGPAEANVYQAVKLTIQDRSCTQDVMEVPDTVPALIGQLPLEALDFVVDPVRQKVIGNPAHRGEQMYDLL